MAYVSNKEKKQQIITALKKAGYNSRKVSVRNRHGSFELTIRDIDVNPERVEAIARGAQVVHRCAVTHEILSGGNTFVSVCWSEKVKQQMIDNSIYAVIVTPETLADAKDNTGVVIGPFAFFQRGRYNWEAITEDNEDRIHIALNWKDSSRISDGSIFELEKAARAYSRRQDKALAK